MNVKQGNKFNFTAPDGSTGTVQVVGTIEDRMVFQHIEGRAAPAKDMINENYFIQLINTNYFRAVE